MKTQEEIKNQNTLISKIINDLLKKIKSKGKWWLKVYEILCKYLTNNNHA